MKPSKRTESPQKRYIFEKAQNDPLHTLHLFRNEDGLFLGNYGNYSAATGTLCVLADGKLLEITAGNAFKGYLEIIYSAMDQEIFINIETAGLEFQRLYDGNPRTQQCRILAKMFFPSAECLIYFDSGLESSLVTLQEPLQLSGKSNLHLLFAILREACFDPSKERRHYE